MSKLCVAFLVGMLSVSYFMTWQESHVNVCVPCMTVTIEESALGLLTNHRRQVAESLMRKVCPYWTIFHGRSSEKEIQLYFTCTKGVQ